MAASGNGDPVISAAVQTRGRTRGADYAFLGEAPENPWWRTYGGYTTFEHPTILLHSDGECWEAFLSGIPSRRRDAVGTTIRFTLVLSGSAAEAGPVLALIGAWLGDIVGTGHVVADALDAVFGEPDVERLLANPDDSDVEGRVLDLLTALPPGPTVAAAASPPDWLWTLEVPEARDAFLLQAGELLDGHAGRALLLNLVGSPTDVEPLLRDPRTLAVLGMDLDPALVALPRGTPPGKAPAPSRGTARRIRTELRAAMVLVAILVVTLVATLGGLIWNR